METKNDLLRIVENMARFDYCVEDKIARGIEENRKGQFRLRFLDDKGEVIRDGVHVRARLVRHAFHFGATTFFLGQMETPEQNALYEKKFKNLFNFAVIPLYWDTLEPERGMPRFAKDSPFISRRPPLDTAVEFCEKNGLDMKGHCLIYNSFQPDWLPKDNREIKIEIDRRLCELASRYKNKFVDVDVINEMLTIYKNCYKGNGCRNLQITDERDHEKWCFDLCKRHFPFSRLYWNEGAQESFGEHYRGYRSFYYMALREWLDKGAPIEGIGMQFHAFWPHWKNARLYDEIARICNPLRQLDVLDCYGEFDLPISLSEVSVPSWHGDGEDEEAQAEIVRRLYRLWFSHKACDSIVWWNFADDTAFQGENIYHAGLIHRDCSEKPAYKVLDELINREWRTEIDADARHGELRFGGFFGDYEIEAVTADGKRTVQSVRLYRDTTGFDNRLCDFRRTDIVIG